MLDSVYPFGENCYAKRLECASRDAHGFRMIRATSFLSSRAKSRDLAGGGMGSDMPCSANREELGAALRNVVVSCDLPEPRFPPAGQIPRLRSG